MKPRFQDRVVVITGAASGIGRATALAFAREGARVHGVDIHAAHLAEAVQEIRAAGGRATEHLADCTDLPAMRALAAAILQREGRVDILHSNAGVVCGGPVETVPLEDWRWVMEVNLWGVVHGILAFLPGMIARGGGHLVNTASMAGLVGFPRVAPYCASKFAVVGLSEALAAELAPHGIRVTVVCPGMVRTRLLESARLELPGRFRALLEQAFARHAASPERIARDTLEAVHRKRFLQVCGLETRLLTWLKRAAPSLQLDLARRLTALTLRHLP